MKLKTKIWWESFGLLIIITAIAISFVVSSKLSASSPFGTYAFRVHDLQDKIIGDFQIFYNFSNKEGNINFEIIGETNPSKIEIAIPEILKITNLNITNETYTLNADKDYKILNEGSLENIVYRLEIGDFKKNLDHFKFNIQFKEYNGIFYPNGRFIVSFHAEKLHYKTDTFGNFDKDSPIKFDLGKYGCLNPCVSELDSDPEDYILATQEIGDTFRIYYADRTKEEPQFFRFVINTFNKKIKRIIDILQSIGIGLIVALISLMGKIIFDIIKFFYIPFICINERSKIYHHRRCKRVTPYSVLRKATLKELEKESYSYCKDCIHEFREK